MVIFGENGYGKSSYVDAIECFFRNRVDHLERENVGRAAYRHRALPAKVVAKVAIDFSESSYSSILAVDSKRRLQHSNTSEEFSLHLDLSRSEKLILRHRELSDFVDKTKREKLQDIAPLLGLQAVDEIRNELRPVPRELSSDLTKVQAAIDERNASLSGLVGKEKATTLDLKAFAIQEVSKLGIVAAVNDLASLKTVLEKIVSPVVTESRQQELNDLQQASRMANLIAKLQDPDSTLSNFQTDFNKLSHDIEALHALALRDLHKAGLTVISGKVWTEGVCPLCLSPIESLDVLARDLVARLEKAAGIEERKDALDNTRKAASIYVDRLRDTCSTAKPPLSGRPDCTTLAAVLDQLHAICGKIEEDLKTELRVDVTVDLNLDQLNSLITVARKQAVTVLTGIQQKIDILQPSAEEKEKMNVFANLKTLAADWGRLESLQIEHGVVDGQLKSMNNVLERFEQLERQLMAEVLSRISKKVTGFYKTLHPREDYDDIELEFLPDDRGVEFSLIAYGERVSPPRLILSESHLNSLGICLFLATALEYNRRNRFLVLDDIVNSFDAGHRAYLADLLVKEFSDIQLIVFTHDPIWFDLLRNLAPHNQWEFRRIVGWSYEQGVLLELSPQDERNRIDGFLKSGEIQAAGNLLRSHLERRLKFLCEETGVRVRFRSGYANDRRTAGELLQDLRNHLNQRQYARCDDPCLGSLAACNFVTTLASHDQRFEIATLNSNDIRFARDKVGALETVFECDKCGKHVWYAKIDSLNYKMQCQCGSLFLV